jgi:hypothetical protein
MNPGNTTAAPPSDPATRSPGLGTAHTTSDPPPMPIGPRRAMSSRAWPHALQADVDLVGHEQRPGRLDGDREPQSDRHGTGRAAPVGRGRPRIVNAAAEARLSIGSNVTKESGYRTLPRPPKFRATESGSSPTFSAATNTAAIPTEVHPAGDPRLQPRLSRSPNRDKYP